MNLLVIPAATDAYYQALKVAENLGQAGVTVLDGPDVTDASKEGIAVGASSRGEAGRFDVPPSDIAGSGGQSITLTCLVWVRTGETALTDARNRCAEILRYAGNVLAADRTMGGTVSSAFIVGGIFDQKLGAGGLIVTIEFRIQARLF